MAKVELKGDPPGNFRVVYKRDGPDETSYQIRKGKKTEVPDEVAKGLNKEIYKVDLDGKDDSKPEKMTKKEIWEMYRDEQMDWLESRGIKPARYEEDRVKQIYKNQ